MKLVDGWLDVAVEIDYLNKSFSRQGHTPKYIVLHGTAGGTSAQAIGNYFATSDVQASSHFIIGTDGTIVQGVPCTLAAWGNGAFSDGHASYLDTSTNPNYYTISIEHCKPSTDNSDQLTPAQQQASFQLIQCLCETYTIPKRAGDASGGIIRHADIDPVNRSRCPGPYPFDGLWTYLKGVPTVNPNMQKSAQDEWNSTAHLLGGTPPRYDSGIAAAWQQEVYQGRNPGPPLTQEYHSVDWNGQAIIVQEFTHRRCEWSSGQAHWYP